MPRIAKQASAMGQSSNNAGYVTPIPGEINSGGGWWDTIKNASGLGSAENYLSDLGNFFTFNGDKIGSYNNPNIAPLNNTKYVQGARALQRQVQPDQMYQAVMAARGQPNFQQDPVSAATNTAQQVGLARQANAPQANPLPGIAPSAPISGQNVNQVKQQQPMSYQQRLDMLRNQARSTKSGSTTNPDPYIIGVNQLAGRPIGSFQTGKEMRGFVDSDPSREGDGSGDWASKSRREFFQGGGSRDVTTTNMYPNTGLPFSSDATTSSTPSRDFRQTLDSTSNEFKNAYRPFEEQQKKYGGRIRAVTLGEGGENGYGITLEPARAVQTPEQTALLTQAKRLEDNMWAAHNQGVWNRNQQDSLNRRGYEDFYRQAPGGARGNNVMTNQAQSYLGQIDAMRQKQFDNQMTKRQVENNPMYGRSPQEGAAYIRNQGAERAAIIHGQAGIAAALQKQIGEQKYAEHKDRMKEYSGAMLATAMSDPKLMKLLNNPDLQKANKDNPYHEKLAAFVRKMYDAGIDASEVSLEQVREALK